MSDKITTLHLKNDPSTNVYPNVKMENIPLDVTIAQGGVNLATSGTIYEFTTSKFLPLTGGTMKGAIMTGGFTSPEEAVLGDGLDVSDLSSQSEPVTHYGSGYIRQDDDEDSSVKYEYKFPKKNGTLALEEDLNKPLEFKNRLDLSDRTKFDLDTKDTTYDNYYLKVQLEDGIYPLDTSSVNLNKITVFNFGPSDGTNLNYHFLKIIQPTIEPVAFNPNEYFCNGINTNQCDIALSHVKDHEYYIIIDRGIVTFTTYDEA